MFFRDDPQSKIQDCGRTGSSRFEKAHSSGQSSHATAPIGARPIGATFSCGVHFGAVARRRHKTLVPVVEGRIGGAGDHDARTFVFDGAQPVWVAELVAPQKI